MTPDDELTAIEERLNAATPGPWEQSLGRNEDAIMSRSVPYPSEDQIRYGGHPIADDVYGADFVFICAAPTDIRALIDALRAERAENERLREEMERLKNEVLGARAWERQRCLEIVLQAGAATGGKYGIALCRTIAKSIKNES